MNTNHHAFWLNLTQLRALTIICIQQSLWNTAAELLYIHILNILCTYDSEVTLSIFKQQKYTKQLQLELTPAKCPVFLSQRHTIEISG